MSNYTFKTPIGVIVEPDRVTTTNKIDVIIGLYSEPEATLDTLKDLPSGWLYVFHGRYLRKEIQVTSTPKKVEYANVDLKRQQGLNHRPANKGFKHLLLQSHELNKPVKLGLAFSRVQWSWARVKAMGGLSPNDKERYSYEIETNNAKATGDPGAVDVSYNPLLADERIQRFDLSHYWDGAEPGEHLYQKEPGNRANALILGLFDPLGVALNMASSIDKHYQRAQTIHKNNRELSKHYDFAVAVNTLVNAPEPNQAEADQVFEKQAAFVEKNIENYKIKALLLTDQPDNPRATREAIERLPVPYYRILLYEKMPDRRGEVNARVNIRSQQLYAPRRSPHPINPGVQETMDRVERDMSGHGDIYLTEDERAELTKYKAAKEAQSAIKKSQKQQQTLADQVDLEGLIEYIQPTELTEQFEHIERLRPQYFEWLTNHYQGQHYLDQEPMAMPIEAMLADYGSLAVNPHYPLHEHMADMLVPSPPSDYTVKLHHAFDQFELNLKEFASHFITTPELWVNMQDITRIDDQKNVLYEGDRVGVLYHNNTPQLVIRKRGQGKMAIIIPPLEQINAALKAEHIRMRPTPANRAKRQSHLKHSSYLYMTDIHQLLMLPAKATREAIDPIFQQLQQAKDNSDGGLYQPGLNEDDPYIDFLYYLAEPNNPWVKLIAPDNQAVDPYSPEDTIQQLIINDGSGHFRPHDFLRQVYLIEDTQGMELGRDLAGSTLYSGEQRGLDLARMRIDEIINQHTAWIAQSRNFLTTLSSRQARLADLAVKQNQQIDALKAKSQSVKMDKLSYDEQNQTRRNQAAQTSTFFLEMYVKTSRLAFIKDHRGLHIGDSTQIPPDYVPLDGGRHFLRYQALSTQEIYDALTHESKSPGLGDQMLARNGKVAAHTRISRVGFFKKMPAYNKKFDMARWAYQPGETFKGRAQRNIKHTITKAQVVLVHKHSPLLESEQALYKKTKEQIDKLRTQQRAISQQITALTQGQLTTDAQRKQAELLQQQHELAQRRKIIMQNYMRGVISIISTRFLWLEIDTLISITNGQFSKESDEYQIAMATLSVLGTLLAAVETAKHLPTLLNATSELYMARTLIPEKAFKYAKTGARWVTSLTVFTAYAGSVFALVEAYQSIHREEYAVAATQGFSAGLILLATRIPHPAIILIGIAAMLAVGFFKRDELESLLKLSMFGQGRYPGIAKYGSDYEWMNEDPDAAYQHLMNRLVPIVVDIEDLSETDHPDDPPLDEPGYIAVTIRYASFQATKHKDIKLYVDELLGTTAFKSRTHHWQFDHTTGEYTEDHMRQTPYGSPDNYDQYGVAHHNRYHKHLRLLEPIQSVDTLSHPGKRYLFKSNLTPGTVAAIRAYVQIELDNGVTLPAPDRRYGSGEALPADEHQFAGWATTTAAIISHPDPKPHTGHYS